MPGARRLFVGSLVARLPLGMESLALLLYFEEHFGSYATAGGLVAVFALGGVTMTPAISPLVTWIGAPRVLAGFAALQCLSFFSVIPAVALGAPLWAVALLVGVAGAFGPPVSASARAAWRTVAPSRQVREVGYTLDAVSQELIWLAGPLLVAVCLPLGGPVLAVALLSVFVVVGTAFFATSPLVAGVGRSYSGGGARVRLSPRVRWLVGAASFSGFGFGAVEVAVPGLADHLGSRNAAGWLLAAMSVGSIGGGLLYSARAWSATVATRQAWSGGILAVLTWTMLGAWSIPSALALAVVAGLAWSPLLASQYALFAEVTSDRETVAVFTWSTTSVVVGAAAGVAAAGLAIERHGPDLAFAMTGAAFGIGGLAALLAPRPQTAS